MDAHVYRVKQGLLGLAIAHIIGGLLLPVLVYLPWTQFYFAWLFSAFNVPMNTSTLALSQFLVGVFGPTVASWGVLFFFAVQQAFKQATRQAWWSLIYACLAWALVDSLYSTLVGMWPNAVLNASVLLIIVAPLWWIRGYFKA